MKKSANVDVGNLFRKFGGDSGNYQEIQQQYVDEKAQQSWPIVTAMEKERAGTPVLKVAVAKRVEPVAGHDELSSAGVKTGSVLSIFARPAPESVAQSTPVNSLFGALGATPTPKHASVSVQAKVEPTTQPAQFQHSESDPLDSVFARLLNPHKSVAASNPENNLRGLLGFLKR